MGRHYLASHGLFLNSYLSSAAALHIQSWTNFSHSTKILEDLLDIDNIIGSRLILLSYQLIFDTLRLKLNTLFSRQIWYNQQTLD